jgi:hypothetical protein
LNTIHKPGHVNNDLGYETTRIGYHAKLDDAKEYRYAMLELKIV